MKAEQKPGNIRMFVRYTRSRQNRWAVVLLSLMMVNAAVGMCNVFMPRWILVIIQKSRESMRSVIFSILAIQSGLFLLRTAGVLR